MNIRTFDYVFEAYLGELILGHSDNLSKFLQNPNLSCVDGWFTANATVETLKSIINDESFALFWEKVLPYAKRLDVNEPTLPRYMSNLELCRTILYIGRTKKWSPHVPKISTTNIIFKPSIL